MGGWGTPLDFPKAYKSIWNLHSKQGKTHPWDDAASHPVPAAKRTTEADKKSVSNGDKKMCEQ